jgi:hypothetical protein
VFVVAARRPGNEINQSSRYLSKIDLTTLAPFSAIDVKACGYIRFWSVESPSRSDRLGI